MLERVFGYWCIETTMVFLYSSIVYLSIRIFGCWIFECFGVRILDVSVFMYPKIEIIR